MNPVLMSPFRFLGQCIQWPGRLSQAHRSSCSVGVALYDNGTRTLILARSIFADL
jgi:hypothetical protein